MRKILLELDDGDFIFWRDETGEGDFSEYGVSIEGYIGFEDLQSFVDMYNRFTGDLEDYLVEEGIEYTPLTSSESAWVTVYKQRSIEIAITHNDTYWIFLDRYKSTSPWNVYHYLRDVIRDIEKIIRENNYI